MSPAEYDLPPHRLSVVIPLYNEVENVTPLVARMHEALAEYAHPWELILVNDGSRDGTAPALDTAAQEYGAHVRVVHLQRNFGQTAAMQAGIDTARGDVIVTLDGDLQNDPEDIPRLVARLLNEDLDLVAGWRKNRQDTLMMRKIPSRIANRLIGRITGVRIHDYGCSLKAYRGDVIRQVRLYGEMHRFIPAWMAAYTQPERIQEEVVAHHPRTRGTSKYGISRTFRVLLDLLVVFFFMRYNARPGHFFGLVGMVFGALGGAALGYLFILKLLGESIGTRPLLITGVLLVLMSAQFLSIGIISEMLTRIYYLSSEHRAYTVRNRQALEIAEDAAWKAPAAA